jgi:hypothetical protein
MEFLFRDSPDPRISAEEIGAVSLAQWNADGARVAIAVHQKAGCPRVSPIEVFDGHLRCSKCFNTLTTDAGSYIWHDLDAGYDKKTNTFEV